MRNSSSPQTSSTPRSSSIGSTVATVSACVFGVLVATQPWKASAQQCFQAMPPAPVCTMYDWVPSPYYGAPPSAVCVRTGYTAPQTFPVPCPQPVYPFQGGNGNGSSDRGPTTEEILLGTAGGVVLWNVLTRGIMGGDHHHHYRHR